jgi:hypothetical protein
LALLAVLACAACGGSKLVGRGGLPRPAPDGDASIDGGASFDGGASSDGARSVWSHGRVFEVVATLTYEPASDQQGAWAEVPRTQRFSLVWDEAGGHAVLGLAGVAVGAPVETVAGGARVRGPVQLPISFDGSCTKTTDVTYDVLSFSVDGLVLGGTASGHAKYQVGDDVLTVPFTAVLGGGPDATVPWPAPPFELVDPLAPLVIPASEPLAAGGRVKLVGRRSHDVVPLDAVGVAAPLAATFAFAKPQVALQYDEIYDVVLDGVADFAGFAAAMPLPVDTKTKPLLGLADGFESVRGATYGGAGVLDGPPLTPIAGKRSLLLNTGFGGGFGFLPYSLGASFAVRLAVPPGAKVVRFERQLIAPDPTNAAMFVGAIRLGSVGHRVEETLNLPATGFQQTTLAGNGDVWVSGVETIERPLPADVGDELVFEIAGVTYQCGLPPLPTVLVLDGLRVE